MQPSQLTSVSFGSLHPAPRKKPCARCCCPLISPPLVPPPHPGHRSSAFCLYRVASSKWAHTRCGLLYLANFTLRDVFRVHPRCGRWQDLVPLTCQLVFFSVAAFGLSVRLLIHVRLLLCCWLARITGCERSVQVFVWTYAFRPPGCTQEWTCWVTW